MPLGQPTSTGGAFLDFKELVRRSEGAVYIFARIHEFKPAETGTKRSELGPVLPVVADIFVATGPDAGQLHPMEEIINAPTAALRGVKNPSAKNQWAIIDPVNELMTPYPFVISIGENAGREYARFDVPKGAHLEQAEALYAKFGDDELWTATAPSASVPAQNNGSGDKESVGAGVGSGGAKPKPWEL